MGRQGREAIVKYLGVASWVLALWLVGTTLWDLQRNWQGHEIASHPDEAAHFVTGMMVFDYVRGHVGENPIAFAEQFYARYPKVALGHWPPGYYAVQALWFGVMGAGIWQAHALNWVLAGGFLFAWWWALRGVFGGALAMGSGAWLLGLPVLHRCAEFVLSDWGAVLWAWVAAVLWVKGRSAIALVLAASLAILTKGNAWMILPALVGAPILIGEWKKIPWREVIAICALSAPFYLWAKANGFSYPLKNATEVDLVAALPGRWAMMREIWAVAPLLLWVLAVAGGLIGTKWAHGEARRWWAVSICFCGATLVFLCFSGLSYEDRAFAVALPFLGLLAMLPVLLWPEKAVICVLALLALVRGPVVVESVKGFRGLADALPEGSRSVLVVSDSVGEGGIIAQVLDRDVKREKVMLRGSRMLSQQYWNGKLMTMRYESAEAIRGALDGVPVQFVLLDSQNVLPYAAQLRELSKDWQLLERRRSDGRILELYAIPTNINKAIGAFRLELGLERGGRAILFRPGPL